MSRTGGLPLHAVCSGASSTIEAFPKLEALSFSGIPDLYPV